MKKLLLALTFVFCAASVSAQGWGIGARVNAGVQLQGEYTFSSENYFDARLGIAFPQGLNIDLTILYQWNIGQWDWTPNAGTWFFDAGVGPQAALFLKEDGGVYAGIAGDAKFGIKFNKVPIRLSIDYTPVLGIAGSYANAAGKKELKEANAELEAMGEPGRYKVKDAHFYGAGLGNFGISATYCF